MPRYRKKPVVIEAEQYVPRFGQVPEGVLDLPEEARERIVANAGLGWIKTLEGGHIVSPYDYIITGVEGEKYPCKPGIFERTYEPVDEES